MTPDHEASRTPAPVSLAAAARYWLRLGFISFGGPAGQIAIMHQDLVERRRWISEHRFLHALNYTMVLPGPEAQQLATYIGWLMHGTAGGIIAGGLFVLPSLLIIMALAWVYLVHHDLALVSGAFYGIKPAVIAIVLAAAHRIGRRSLTTPFKRCVAVLAFLALAVAKVPFPWIIGTAAAAGFLVARLCPAWVGGDTGHEITRHTYGPALIDDDTPIPPYARFSWHHVVAFALCGILIWVAGMALLVQVFGWHGTCTQMAWFFTKSALLTFGGAYAVLPYVYQGAVLQFGWLTATQMIDGLALGETTPGPLIMIVAFVGFIGGWGTATADAGSAGAAILGAVVATAFTFLPSFIFIFVGAPAVEATRHELHVSAPLAAITAAVVGVVVNLAVFFAQHVIWPGGWDAAPDLTSLALSVAACIALFRLHMGIMPLIGTAALCGVLLRMAGMAP